MHGSKVENDAECKQAGHLAASHRQLDAELMPTALARAFVFIVIRHTSPTQIMKSVI
jgi:hypothetical protein